MDPELSRFAIEQGYDPTQVNPDYLQSLYNAHRGQEARPNPFTTPQAQADFLQGTVLPGGLSGPAQPGAPPVVEPEENDPTGYYARARANIQSPPKTTSLDLPTPQEEVPSDEPATQARSGGFAPPKVEQPGPAPFPLISADEYESQLKLRGWTPEKIAAEVSRYKEYLASVPGMTDQLESEKFQSQQEAGRIEQERLGVQQGLAAQEPDRIAGLQDSIKAERDRWAAKRQLADQELQNEIASFRSSIDEIRQTVPDSEQYWEKNSRPIAAIAVALGAVGSALTGVPNFALQAIQDGIDNNIKTQLAAGENKKAAANAQMNLVQMLKGRLGDADQAVNVATAMLYEDSALQAEYMAAQSGNADAIAKAKLLAEDLRSKGKQAEMAYSILAQQRADQRAEMLLRAQYAAANQNNYEEGGDYEVDVGDDEHQVILPVQSATGEWELFEGTVPDKDQAKSFRVLAEKGQRALKDLEYLKRIGQGGISIPKAERSDLANQVLKRLNADLAGMEQEGVGKAFTQTESDNLGANPNWDNTDLFTTNAEPLINEQIQDIKSRMDIAKRYIAPGKVNYNRIDPDTGKVRRRTVTVQATPQVKHKGKGARPATEKADNTTSLKPKGFKEGPDPRAEEKRKRMEAMRQDG